MRVLDLFERAHFSGFTCSTLERKPGSGFHDIAPGESAIAARRALAAIQQRLTAEHWSVIWHVLAFGEAQSAFALRVRCRKAAVRPMLQSALMAVAALSRAR